MQPEFLLSPQFLHLFSGAVESFLTMIRIDFIEFRIRKCKATASKYTWAYPILRTQSTLGEDENAHDGLII